MRSRTIAGTDITLSEIGFGVWTVAAGWWGDYTDQESQELLHRAFDQGITYFDTADTYGHGRGETILGSTFSGMLRERITIGAKFGYDWQARSPADSGHRESPHRFDIPFLQQALDASLRRLGTDRIDVYQMHNPRMEHLLDDDVWTWVDRMRRDGKIRSAGVALGPAIGWEREGHYALQHLPIQSAQVIYNALELDPGRALIRTAELAGRSLLVRVPHSSGMLEGHYTDETVFPERDHRRHRPRSWLLDGVRKVEQLRFLERDNHSTIGQAALQFALRPDPVVTALPNVYNVEQIDEFTTALDRQYITDEQARKIERMYETNYGMSTDLLSSET